MYVYAFKTGKLDDFRNWFSLDKLNNLELLIVECKVSDAKTIVEWKDWLSCTCIVMVQGIVTSMDVIPLLKLCMWKKNLIFCFDQLDDAIMYQDGAQMSYVGRQWSFVCHEHSFHQHLVHERMHIRRDFLEILWWDLQHCGFLN